MPRRLVDQRIDFLSPVSLIPGLGLKRVEALKESGITEIGELLHCFPHSYVDRSIITPAGEIAENIDKCCCVVGEITRTRVEKGRKPRLRILLADSSGEMEALWFHGIPYLRHSLHTGMRVALTGKVSLFGKPQMLHPLVETLGSNRDVPEAPYLPRYSISLAMREAGVGQKSLYKSIRWALQNLRHWPNSLPSAIEEQKSFPPLAECFLQIHRPDNLEDLDKYRARLRYEELYQVAIALRWSKRKFALPGRPMSPGDLFQNLRAGLPYELTDDQQDAVGRFHADSQSSKRMHRLLQGDVGSGKTVVAFAACLPALNEGHQVAWLAPTEILARQTLAVVSPWLERLGYKACLLHGSLPAAEKRRIQTDLAQGKHRFVIGTHALLQPAVRFAGLGMIVIDEQHRFGVQQRLKLQEKDPAADFLLMSATPIPQSLAKTLYGDLDIVSLRTRPLPYLPPTTRLVPDIKRTDMERFVLSRIRENGAQVFYVAPRIEPSDEEGANLTDVQSAFESLTQGTFHGIAVALLHGGMGTDEKERVMHDFVGGKIKVLVATTVVEVGLDVPGASMMVIENAERFGLAQLHQLRGRIGRHGGESFCFLLADMPDGGTARERLSYFCKEHDGFALADADLKMRGPGEVSGFRQSGWEDLRIADILRDANVFREIQGFLDTLLVG